MSTNNINTLSYNEIQMLLKVIRLVSDMSRIIVGIIF